MSSERQKTVDGSEVEREELVLPVKSVEADVSVEGRLTDNVVDRIGPQRYFVRDGDGDPDESWGGVFERVATNVARAEDRPEDWSDTFYAMMAEQRFMPNSPTLMNAGTELQQLSACFVSSPQDSMESINDTQSEAAEVFKSGGGMGYAFHHLRPKGAVVSSTGGVSSGPLSFMELFDTTCGTVQQGGCVSTDERVMTDSGYVPLGDVHDGPPLKESPNGDARVYSRGGSLDAVVESSESGTMPTYTIETASGYTITVSHDHPVMVLREDGLEYEMAENITEEDTVVLSKEDKRVLVRAQLPDIDDSHPNGNEPEYTPDVVTDDFARFVGVLLGDGTVDTEYNRIIFSLGNDGNGDIPAKKFITGYLDRLGVTYHETNKDTDGSGKGNYTEYRVNSKPLVDWLVGIGIDGDRSIPEVIYRSPMAFDAFLDGMTVDASYHQDANTFTYVTAHESFAEELQDILLATGIASTVRTVETNGEGRYSDGERYSVMVHPGDSAARFDSTVNTFLDGYVEAGGQRKNRVDSPEFIDSVLDDHFEKGNMLPEDVDRASMKELRRYARGDRTPSLSRLRSVLTDVGIDPDEYEALDTENLFEPVSTITTSSARVCDIENKTGSPEYVASNFVVHNKRRGAQMAIMDALHPDIGRFVVSKRGEDRFTNFNISVGITDEFFDAVKNDETYVLRDPQTRPHKHSLLSTGEPFEVVPETAHFYDPEFEDAWNEDFNKPGVGIDGKVVEENLWRDYSDEFAVDIDQFRDRIDLTPGEPLELPARLIWNLLIDGAHNNGEPGIFYLDKTNREHSFDIEEHPDHVINSTNPCSVTGDTKIHTESGMIEIGELAEDGGPESVVTDSRLGGDVLESASDAWATGEDEVYVLETEEGYSMRLTADHMVRTDNGWVEAQDLAAGDSIHVLDRKGSFGSGGSKDLGEVLGWVVGDGHVKHGEERAVLNFYGDDTNFSDRFAESVNAVVRDPESDRDYTVGVSEINRSNPDQGSSVLEQRIRSTRLYEIIEDVGLDEEKLQVPDDIFSGSEEYASGFLRGLFSADGSVQGTKEKGYSVRLGTTSIDLAHQVQELLSNFGIYSRVYENRRDGGSTELPDGNGGTAEYDTKALHEVSITSEDLIRFRDEIGFINDRKQESLERAIDSYDQGPYSRDYTATVSSVEYDGTETVYDITEPVTKSFVANGLVVHNSEQPLEDYEACNLGHVNLSLMVDEDAPSFNEFNGSPEEYLDVALDIDLFESTVRNGVRFLDDVVTMSEFPIDEISKQVTQKRKIGLGLMGYHQMLIQMGIQYGSRVSYDIARDIMRRIDAIGTDASHRLALERGTFEQWEDSKWSDPTSYPEWFEKHGHADPDEWSDGYPIRNHNITTVAPTGTTSMIGNTTGGIEPIYQVAYFKNVGDDIQGDEMLVEFDDYFLRVLEANDIDVEAVKDEATEKMMNNEFEGVEDLDLVPDDIGELFVTTQDLTPEQHVRTQASFQHYCDSGLSKTLNLPNDATIDDASDAFELALDLNIKGTTIYRDGSRNEQVKTTRVDNNLDDTSDLSDEQVVEYLVDQRNLSVKAEHELREDLGVLPEAGDESIERECPECGSGKVNLAESCPFCPECGWSKCE